MRYAIISDIHNNLEAFNAVINSCKKQNIDAYFCVGDIVGYAANPKECLNIIYNLEATCVAGNHDWAVGGRLDASYFRPEGKIAVNWTRQKVSFEDIQFLHDLQLIFKNDDFIMAHGTLNNPEQFNYLYSVTEAADTFSVMDRNICFVGHTHIPQIYLKQKDRIYYFDVLQIEIIPDAKYIVNVGSVGQPRDGIPMSSYCIFDTKLGTIEIKRVQYDIESAQKKILDAGLPGFLASRLSVGT